MQKKSAPTSKLIFVLGTVAELIKIFPVIKQLEELQADWIVWSTGQSRDNFRAQYVDLLLPLERLYLPPTKLAELTNAKSALIWFFTSLIKSKKKIIKENGPPFSKNDKIIVHGDTLSTLLGSLYAKKWGCRLYHIEAGMRSGGLLSPFPEEITRKIVSGLADVHFAQDERAIKNLGHRKKVVHTFGNTAIEAHHFAPAQSEQKRESEKFILVNLHRFENISSSVRFNFIMEMMIEAGKKGPVLFIAHPHVEERINKDPKLPGLLKKAGVKVIPRVLFSEFIGLLNQCECLITDGHGNQEECYWLGTPCLVLREKTEIDSGLGSNCVKCNFDRAQFLSFLEDHQGLRVPPRQRDQSPSLIIAKHLTQELF